MSTERKFIVTITEVSYIEKLTPGAWKVMRQEVVPYEEVKTKGWKIDNTEMLPIRDVYDYLPPRLEQVKSEVQVYRQEFLELDVKTVARFLNQERYPPGGHAVNTKTTLPLFDSPRTAEKPV